jgi:hypothetical protein
VYSVSYCHPTELTASFTLCSLLIKFIKKCKRENVNQYSPSSCLSSFIDNLIAAKADNSSNDILLYLCDETSSGSFSKSLLYAHQLNLCVVKGCSILQIRNASGTISEISKFLAIHLRVNVF